jgi:apolipoprotein D and lipocalin family protein
MEIKNIIKIGFFGIIGLLLTACSDVTIPPGAMAVTPFDKAKYLGKWYEIARLDFQFERNLNNTTATYTLNSNGSIKVDNQGYNVKTKKWTQAIGNAVFVGDQNVAMLKVSFFGPFYSGYNVIALDSEYKYALVAGKDLSYLWLLSREKTMPELVKQNYLSIAQNLGYNTASLIWVLHDQN